MGAALKATKYWQSNKKTALMRIWFIVPIQFQCLSCMSTARLIQLVLILVAVVFIILISYPNGIYSCFVSYKSEYVLYSIWGDIQPYGLHRVRNIVFMFMPERWWNKKCFIRYHMFHRLVSDLTMAVEWNTHRNCHTTDREAWNPWIPFTSQDMLDSLSVYNISIFHVFSFLSI